MCIYVIQKEFRMKVHTSDSLSPCNQLPPEACVSTVSRPVWWPAHVGEGHRRCEPGKSLIGRLATAHVNVADGLQLCGV